MSLEEQIDDEFVEDCKRWFHSKTIWANLAALIPAALFLLEQYWPTLQGVLSPKAYAGFGILIALINLQLRRITRKPIK